MERPESLVIVIFGATGDLTSRMLVPALYSLRVLNMMPEKFALVGGGRSELTTEAFRDKMQNAILTYSSEKDKSDSYISAFTENFHYCKVEYSEPAAFEKLKSFIDGLCETCNIRSNIIFYMATPPNLYQVISANLFSAGLTTTGSGFRRFIYEKPFGYDLESGRELNSFLHGLMGEDQIFRIDHYLGKESVQNLLVTRFANGVFEPLWNRNYVHHVEVTSAESLGVGDRGGYYDSAGALRDMVPNHLLQMVGLIAMEPPSSLDPNAIRNEVLKVFQSFQPFREEEVEKMVIRGQYTPSLIRGECVNGYRQEKGVDVDSRTETYVAMKFYINNWRWGGVPFYIRTGKRMPTRVTEVVIHFRPTPHHLFRRPAGLFSSNQLILRIQPDEGILLKFDMKEPGAGFNVKNVEMDFHYSDLSYTRVPSAYERLLHDVMLGDSTLFSRDDEIETAWRFIGPIQKAWEANPSIRVYGYPAGTWGPVRSNDLFGGPINWRMPSKNLADEELYCEL